MTLKIVFGEEKACEWSLLREKEREGERDQAAQGNDRNHQSFPEQEGEEAQKEMCEAEYSISAETNILF